jgi:uncharacterized membrane protein YbaN (DUF454 family)
MQRSAPIEMEDLGPSGLVSRSRLTRWALIAAGSLLVGIGVLGIFLPLLPTTVFFLGAAACFGKSSPGAYRWLTTNRYFGRYLRDYKEEHGATLATKLFSVGSLWAGIGLTGYLFRDVLWIDAILLAVAAGVTWHLLSLRTLRR